MTTYKIAINTMSTGKLPQGDPRWAIFNDSFENMELEVIDIANYIYLGHAYTTWHTGRRSLSNFTLGHHIAVDFDTGDERSDIERLEQNEFIRAYGGLIHTTPSHTDQSPRARVIFFLDRPIINADAYGAAASFLVNYFDGADKSCTDASRFFYGSRDCAIALLMNELPVTHLRRYYKQWQKTQPKQQVISTRKAEPQQDALAEGTTKQSIGTLQEAQQVLDKLNPWDIEYKQWIGVLAALHDEFGDAALSVAESWAQGKPGEVARRWKTFGKYSGNKASLRKITHLVGN